jgi:hypothetical protein
VFSGAAVTLAPELYAPVRALPYVQGVFPDDTVRATLEQSVPLIGADRVASQLHGTGAGIRVGIVDTGIDYDHPAFGGGFGPGHRVVGGFDFINDDPDPRDDNGHGTHVAGIVGGNGGGVVGVATGATLYAFKVLDSDGYGFDSWILAGFERVLDPDQNPATEDAMQVINLSFGSSQGGADDPMSVALDHLTEAGVVCVAAAGNWPAYFAMGAPATSRLAITVGASTKADGMADFSTPGPVNGSLDLKPDLVAPGVDIVSAAMGGGRVAMSGTSMAAPHVTGVVAQLLQLHPDWTPDEMKAAVTGTAKDLGQPPFQQGAGRVDAYAAATASFLVTPGHLSFGRDDDSQSVWVASDTLHVANVTGSPRTVRLPASVMLAIGAELKLSPSVVTIAAGASAPVLATLTVNNGATPFPSAAPFGYTATIAASAGTAIQRVPVSFHKAASLRAHSSDLLSQLIVHDRRPGGFAASPDDPRQSFLLPPGTYDVMASFYPFFSFVVREGVAVSGDTDLSLASSEAGLDVGFENVGPNGAPVDCNLGSLSLYDQPVGIGFTFLGFGFRDIRTSALSSDYRLEWTRSAVHDPISRVTFCGTLSGVAVSQVVSNGPADLRHVAMSFPRVPADSAGLLVFQLMPFRNSPGYFGVAWFDPTTPPIVGPFTYDQWIQLAPYRDHLLSMQFTAIDRRVGDDLVADFQLFGSYLHLDRGWPLVGSTLALIDSAAFYFGGEHMNLFGGIPVWQGWMINGPGYLALYNASGLWAPHLISDMYGTAIIEPDPPFTLSRDGIVVVSDTLRGAGGFNAGDLTCAIAPGAYDFDLSRPYALRGRSAAMAVRAHFDTRLIDQDPPWLRTLQLFSDGEATDSIAFQRALDAGLRFEMLDVDTSTATTAWVRGRGDPLWTPLAVERHGRESRVRFPPSLSGEIALRLVGLDAAGNSLILTWDPAFIAVPGALPAITSLAADARGGAARVVWRVAANAGQPLDVERRERSTDWQTLGVTTVDADGVAAWDDFTALAGHAYAYRLSVALGGSPQASSEVWITVPVAAEFALAGTRPNPALGAGWIVEFSLPGASPATLALYDLAGRRVHAVEVGALGTGRHLLRFAPPDTRPGIYFLRLTQSGRSLTARACVLR